MGLLCTTTQIYTPIISSPSQFANLFCQKMLKEGYVICDSDESEISYILRFADSCKWVTVISDAYEQGNQFAQTDTGRIAKMLKTACISTTVIDSDCAILDLYDGSGKKADSLIIGRADDYFGDDIPQPSEELWKPFLSSATTWEQFSDIQNEDNTFVEDSLKELAPMIGMDDQNILLSADEAHEDEQTVFLYFKKDTTQNKKKPSFNAAIKHYFAEALKPLGFQVVKNKSPYFIRIVNNEFIHVIAIIKDSFSGTFGVLGGIATIYRKKLDFSEDLKSEVGHWLMHTGFYYRRALPSDYSRVQEIAMSRCPIPDMEHPDEVQACFKKALENTMTWLMPELDQVSDADSAIRFLFFFAPECLTIFDETDPYYDFHYYNESCLFLKAKDVNAVLNAYADKIKVSHKFCKIHFKQEPNCTAEDIVNPIREKLQLFLVSDKSRSNAERNTTHNLQILKKYAD